MWNIFKIFKKREPLRSPTLDIIDEMDLCFETGDKERYNYLMDCLDKIGKGEMEIKEIKKAGALKGETHPPIILN